MGARINSRLRKSLQRRLSEAQNHRCAYCGGDIRVGCTIDHLVPQASGGKHSYLNTVAACADCNRRRDRENPLVFFRRQQELAWARWATA
jgi:5-methylcytosine-specific restriction endonuclease McrA